MRCCRNGPLQSISRFLRFAAPDMLQLRQGHARQHLRKRQFRTIVKGCWGFARQYATSHQSSTPTAAKSKDEVIFSGIQPTGVPHLGNYLGALRQWATLQNESPADTKLIYSIVDLHAITVRPDPEQLRRWKRETLATMLAIGLDPTRSTIFYQSAVGPECRFAL